jgi:hypothetical protein
MHANGKKKGLTARDGKISFKIQKYLTMFLFQMLFDFMMSGLIACIITVRSPTRKMVQYIYAWIDMFFMCI